MLFTGAPPVSWVSRPNRKMDIPRVMMKGWARPWAASTPLTKPTAVAAKIPATTATPSGALCSRSRPVMMLAKEML